MVKKTKINKEWASELTEIMDRYKLTCVSFSIMLGCHFQTLRNYVNEVTPVPKYIISYAREIDKFLAGGTKNGK